MQTMTGRTNVPEAFIYDHVRTPRGRGKPDGALHEVSTLGLATTVLRAIKDRGGFDTHLVDDVVLGCVDPVGEAGGDIARAAALAADYGDHVPGVQINRFCASGLDAVNFAAAQVMAGQHHLTVGGGVESMSRVGLGASGGAWPAKVWIFPRRRRSIRGGVATTRGKSLERRPVQKFGRTGARHQWHQIARSRRTYAAIDRYAVARRAETFVHVDGRARRF
jgi:acetyl-CoA acetyltransferase